MKIINKLIIIFGLFILFCNNESDKEIMPSSNDGDENISSSNNNNESIPSSNDNEENMPICDGFDYPIGKPDGKGYYNAQKFGENTHLGEDWNGVKGGNSDLGDPVYSIADGLVVFSEDVGGGWGNVIRIIHKYKDDNNEVQYLESVYAHFKDVFVEKGEKVLRGQKIGTIGNVGGRYYAHLHFELRNRILMQLGGGYSTNTEGFLDPTKFINKHRPNKK